MKQMISGSPALRNAFRSYHSVSTAASKALATETPVTVYQGADYATYQRANESHDFASNVMASPHKGKFFSLLPFWIEAAFTPKFYIVKMELYPGAELLAMHTLGMGGVHTAYVPVKEVIPITKYDYWCASWKFWAKQNVCLDLDMIYANKNSKDMYVFDKDGEWNDEGIYHDALSLDQTYNETMWYDEFNVHNF